MFFFFSLSRPQNLKQTPYFDKWVNFPTAQFSFFSWYLSTTAGALTNSAESQRRWVFICVEFQGSFSAPSRRSGDISQFSVSSARSSADLWTKPGSLSVSLKERTEWTTTEQVSFYLALCQLFDETWSGGRGQRRSVFALTSLGKCVCVCNVAMHKWQCSLTSLSV